MIGRAISLELPPQLFEQLPYEFLSEPVLRFIPFYFNQGIDIVQSLATGKNSAERKLQSLINATMSVKASRMGNDTVPVSVSSNRVQFDINQVALSRLNDYLHKLLPVELSAEYKLPAAHSDGVLREGIPIHPLLNSLDEIVRNTKESVKVTLSS